MEISERKEEKYRQLEYSTAESLAGQRCRALACSNSSRVVLQWSVASSLRRGFVWLCAAQSADPGPRPPLFAVSAAILSRSS